MKFFDQVHRIVAQIPPGRVATYGQVARLLWQPHAARTVGWALRGVPDDGNVPWHRVVNAAGRISISDRDGISEKIEALGVNVDYVGTIISNLIKDGYVPMVF